MPFVQYARRLKARGTCKRGDALVCVQSRCLCLDRPYPSSGIQSFQTRLDPSSALLRGGMCQPSGLPACCTSAKHVPTLQAIPFKLTPRPDHMPLQNLHHLVAKATLTDYDPSSSSTPPYFPHQTPAPTPHHRPPPTISHLS